VFATALNGFGAVVHHPRMSSHPVVIAMIRRTLYSDFYRGSTTVVTKDEVLSHASIKTRILPCRARAGEVSHRSVRNLECELE